MDNRKISIIKVDQIINFERLLKPEDTENDLKLTQHITNYVLKDSNLGESLNYKSTINNYTKNKIFNNNVSYCNNNDRSNDIVLPEPYDIDDE